MKANLKSKLSSRKFWLAIIGFVTTMLVTFGVPDMTIEKVTGLISALGMLIAYIIAEAHVDGKREEGMIFLDDEDASDERDGDEDES